MSSFKRSLLSTAVIPAFIGAGLAVAGSTSVQAADGLLPVAKPKPVYVEIAAHGQSELAMGHAKKGCNPCKPKGCNPCNPCAAKKGCNPCNPCAAKKGCNPCNPCAAKKGCNPCNPCAAKKGCNPCNPCAAKKGCNPCNPCAAKGCNPCNPCGACNPCNPCGAGGGSVSAKCVVPRLAAAACNPCAAKKGCNPCNPCAAKKGCNPCNPCAAKKGCNPCNPCAAKKGCNPCNPCAAKNPCNPCGGCNPCGAGGSAEISPAEAQAVYNCLKPEMTAAYAKAGYGKAAGYTGWVNIASSAYQSATHGGRYVNNYVSPHGDYRYQQFEKAGTMPAGTVLAKDSFVVKGNGKVAVGPLFIMEKMKPGSNKGTHDWKYVMIMPNGKIGGSTGSKKGISMQFCADCHNSAYPETDGLLLLPDEFRKKY